MGATIFWTILGTSLVWVGVHSISEGYFWLGIAQLVIAAMDYYLAIEAYKRFKNEEN